MNYARKRFCFPCMMAWNEQLVLKCELTADLFIYTSKMNRHTELVVLQLGTRNGFGLLRQRFMNLKEKANVGDHV